MLIMKLIIMYNNESCSIYRNIKLADDSVTIRLLEGKELDHFKIHDFFRKRSTVTPPTLIKVSSYKYSGVFLDNKLGFAEVTA